MAMWVKLPPAYSAGNNDVYLSPARQPKSDVFWSFTRVAESALWRFSARPEGLPSQYDNIFNDFF
jgi:hypothetical protein